MATTRLSAKSTPAAESVRTGLTADVAAPRRARQPRVHAGALPRVSRRPTTGTWRSPTACTTACSRAGSRRASSYTARDVKVACYLSAEFLIGPQLGNNLVNLGIEARSARGDAGARSGSRCARRARRGTGPRQRRPRPAGGVLSRFACDACRCRPSAMACATSSASSIRRSATAGRSKSPTSGCSRAIRGSWCTRRSASM